MYLPFLNSCDDLGAGNDPGPVATERLLQSFDYTCGTLSIINGTLYSMSHLAQCGLVHLASQLERLRSHCLLGHDAEDELLLRYGARSVTSSSEERLRQVIGYGCREHLIPSPWVKQLL